MQTMKKYSMLSPGDGVVVALSGGADSVALLAALLCLREEYALTLYAVHVNHGLRASADGDEKFVRRLCKNRGVPLRVFTAKVREEAERQKISIEEAGRRARYESFNTALAGWKAHKIATGHNMNDNAETVLLNLCRGAGLKGLCGIPPVNGNIVRPLIETTRGEIEAYLKENKIKYINDATNAESDFTRNRVRNKIIPALHEHINPNAAVNIARNTALLRADAEYLDDAAKDAFAASATSAQFEQKLNSPLSSPISLNIPHLLTQPEVLRYRMIKEAIVRVRGSDTDIQANHIFAVLDIANGVTGRETHLPGISVRRVYDELHFTSAKSARDTDVDFFYPLQLDKPLYIPEIDKTITVSPCTHSPNYDILPKCMSELCVRTRRPGDRVFLSGGSKKLQDYFTDAKIPRHLRDRIPLVAMGNEILCIMEEML
jgi:tRNA(Ile)-lysidine synthase